MTTILFFGEVSDRLGRERPLSLPAEGATVGEIRRRLAQAHEEADILLRPQVRAAVDHETVTDDALVRPGQEIVFFSVVSGG